MLRWAYRNVDIWGPFIDNPYPFFLFYDILPSLFSGMLAAISCALSLLAQKRKLLTLFLPGLVILAANSFITDLSPSIPRPILLITPQFAGFGQVTIGSLLGFFGLLLGVFLLLVFLGVRKNRDLLGS